MQEISSFFHFYRRIIEDITSVRGYSGRIFSILKHLNIINIITYCSSIKLCQKKSVLQIAKSSAFIGKARNVLELLNKEDLLADMIQECSSAGGLVVRIGSENKIQDLNDCSVVTASYSVNGVELGTIGVLGPTRMDYSKVISALEYVRKGLEEGLGKKPKAE